MNRYIQEKEISRNIQRIIKMFFFTARKRSFRRLCFDRCLSVHRGGGGVRGCSRGVHAWLLRGGGHVWFYSGGVHGFIWGGRAWFYLGGGHVWFYLGGHAWFYFGGHAWFYLGGHAWFYSGGHAWFYLGGCAWFYSGGMRGFIQGGMHGFMQGACVVLFWGGMRGFFSFFRYNEIQSMSGRYASYWNAFLLSYRFSGFKTMGPREL